MDAVDTDRRRIDVVRVFTDPSGRFGNPLGIVRAAQLGDRDPQELAATLGYSETVVVGEPADGTAELRIFTPMVELPFAGHPTIGTAWWLADHGTAVETLLVTAGKVQVSRADGMTWVRARPDWAPEFTFHELGDADDVVAADPAHYPAGQHYVWAWVDQERGAIRSRMFAPGLGVAEDEATGAAAVALTARLRRSLRIVQGQGSQLFTSWDSDGWVDLGGRVAAADPVQA
ncbi:PhzF family phenazine biosynthesis protein [Nocardia stercoris]|uniref:PhzF family phenazine biosynthesis protein n=1 Tax=Nocardia stercoris TaxID=2483361 RepID=UPI001F1B44E7|nr:PhzF family phenazine biosynthesis protein [Nocardia stercoris]